MSGITYKHVKANREEVEALDQAGRILEAQNGGATLNVVTNLKSTTMSMKKTTPKR